ncbi:hypothetical protein ACOMHN_042619 [Nucella lapillus]
MTKGTEKQPLTSSPAGSPSPSPSPPRRVGVDCCLSHINAITRLCGMAVLAAMWAATVTTLRGDFELPTYVGYYLLGASLIVTFFEITWILDKMACCVRQGCCCRCWSIILWVDGWRKFVLYAGLTVPLFLQGLKGAFHVVCGFCLLVLACLYLVKSFASLKSGNETQREKSASQDLRQITVVRHEAGTQTDVISPSTAKKEAANVIPTSTAKMEAPPNPFDEDEGEDEEGTEEGKENSTDDKSDDIKKSGK